MLSSLLSSCSMPQSMLSIVSFFFFNDTSTTEIYTLSLHDALPIYSLVFSELFHSLAPRPLAAKEWNNSRSEERFSRNAETDLVCRLLLEKKKKQFTTKSR